MTGGLDLDRLRTEPVAYRLEIEDFGAFYERTYDLAYRTALGIVRDPGLAADVTQEAYVSAYKHRDRFRGEAPSGAWLYRIVVNQALAVIRRRRALGTAPAMGLTSPDDVASATIRLALYDALEALPPRQRAAVVLRYYHDFNYATIAQILKTTSTNVGAMLTRALDRLKVTLEPDPTPVTQRVVSHED
jgi:RNA polymerase sigma-70 factor (ECF subfamily)